MGAHVVAHVIPNGQKNTLALVVTRAIFVRLAKISKLNWPVYRTHDFGQGDVVWMFRQNVSTTDPSLGPHESGAFERKQDLFKVWLRETGAKGNIANRLGGERFDVKCHGEQRTTRVVTSRRNPHNHILPVPGFATWCPQGFAAGFSLGSALVAEFRRR
jgi:hypothetical protein